MKTFFAMRKLGILLSVGFSTLMPANAAFAEENAGVTGLWQSESNKHGDFVIVHISACESDAQNLCGIVTEAHSTAGRARGHDLEGMMMLENLKPKPDGETFGGGRVHIPQTDDVYPVTISPEGELLKVEACVLFICKNQKWTRPPPPLAPVSAMAVSTTKQPPVQQEPRNLVDMLQPQ